MRQNTNVSDFAAVGAFEDLAGELSEAMAAFLQAVQKFIFQHFNKQFNCRLVVECISCWQLVVVDCIPNQLLVYRIMPHFAGNF